MKLNITMITKLIIKLLTFISTILKYLSLSSDKIINSLNKEIKFNLINLSFDKNLRCYQYHFNNINRLTNYKDILLGLYTSLIENKDFINFGNHKVIIVSSVIYNVEHSFHHNVLITNKTTFEEYFNTVIDYIDQHYDEADNYGIEVIPSFKVKV